MMIGGILVTSSRNYKKLLVDLRGELVGKLHAQPFTIYNDKTIEELIRVKPKTISELEKVKGFPPKGKRITGFGEAVIAIFNDEDIQEFCIHDGNKPSIETKIKPMKLF